MNQSFLDFLSDYHTIILKAVFEHIELVGLSALIAIAIGVGLGIYLAINDSLAELVLQLAAIIMTIPSLALFGLMMPILSTFGHGTGFIPAMIALILYSQLPIIRNTYVAIKNVDPSIRDAANGLGMTKWQRIRRVEIPNAFPLIMAGVRSAIVLSIGIGTIAAFIGAGGLGGLIDTGILRSNKNLVIAGGIAVALVTILFDIVFNILQKWVTPKGMQ